MTTNKLIAIDPGHVGGEAFDLREMRTEWGVLKEGAFAFAWAESLAGRLQQKGLATFLTRKKGLPSQVITPEQRAKRKGELIQTLGVEASLKKFRVPKFMFQDLDDEFLFHAGIQNEFDLLQRSAAINASGAEFCLSLHLNGDISTYITEQNGICGFTNSGSRSHYDLFARMIASVSQSTGVPVLETWNTLEVVRPGLFVDETLTLMRNVQIPILLLEGPYQNNGSEIPKFIESLEVWNRTNKATGRLADLTEGVVKGLGL